MRPPQPNYWGDMSPSSPAVSAPMPLGIDPVILIQGSMVWATLCERASSKFNARTLYDGYTSLSRAQRSTLWWVRRTEGDEVGDVLLTLLSRYLVLEDCEFELDVELQILAKYIYFNYLHRKYNTIQ